MFMSKSESLEPRRFRQRLQELEKISMSVLVSTPSSHTETEYCEL